MRAIDLNFIITCTLLILNSIVGIADFLQAGYIWPLFATLVFMQMVIISTRRTR
jgi:hypothetical protein